MKYGIFNLLYVRLPRKRKASEDLRSFWGVSFIYPMARIALLLCLCWGFMIPSFASSQQLGINLAGLHDWNSELPFVDFFRLSRLWVSQEKGKAWGKGPPLSLDARGWITLLPPGTWAETCILNIRGGHYPHGTYRLLFDGKGKIDINNVNGAFRQREGEVTFDVTGKEQIIWIQIKETDPTDYIRNIRVYPPDTADMKELLRAGFLDRWRGMKSVRFMEFMAINNSQEKHWSDRVKMDDATWTRHGAPLEAAVAVANALHASPWFSMPHLADDDYVEHFAQMVKERLSPELSVYVEYSNETWNPLFAQTRYCREQGLSLHLASNPVQAGHRYAVQRSLEIFALWQKVFGSSGSSEKSGMSGSSSRLIRVIAGQAANPGVNEERLTFHEAWKQCDALAIAPYLTFNVSANSRPPLVEVRNWSLLQLEDEVSGTILHKSIEWMRSAQKTASRYHVALIAYEGGQHLVGIQGAENDEQLTRLFLQINGSSQMGRIYDRYLQQWQNISSDGLFCLWLSTEIWSKWGSWGLAEYHDDAGAQSPKLQAVLRRISSHSSGFSGETDR